MGLRCYGYGETPLYTDERLWIERAEKVLVKLSSDPTSATTHLGQPGIPPTLLIALGQRVARSWNGRLGLAPGDALYLGVVDASRIPIVILSTLIAPLLFLLIFEIAGVGVALFAALGVAIDPYLLACSKMIHLDAVLSLLVLSTLFVYHFAILRSSLRLKLGAGVLWGLSIATKPTAVLLIPCFLLYRAIRELLRKRGATLAGDRGFLAWSDLGAVAVGHLVFSLLYTRLWVHRSDYLTRLNIRSPLAGELFHTGRWLQSNPLLAILILLSLVALFVLALRMLRSRWSWPRYHVVCALFSIIACFMALLMVPQVVENVVRYWTWVLGLSHETYRAFVSNVTVNVHPHGYHELAFMHLPSLVTVCAILGLLGLARSQLWRRCPLHLIPLLGVIVALPILWGLLLSSSEKQSWRYAMPVLFCIYFLAGIGVIKVVGRYLPQPRAVVVLAGILIGWLLLLAVGSTPYGLFFRSSISGGLPGHVAKEYGIEHFVSEDLEDLLFKGAHPGRQPLRVMVLGDVPLQLLGVKRFAPQWKDRVIFSGPGMHDPQRVLGYAPFLHRLDRYPGDLQVFTYEGVPLAGVKVISQ